jgi:simple sugar transport system ATP-binding protein
VLGYLERPEAGEGPFLDLKRITKHCSALLSRYDVRPQNAFLHAEDFSGGNQQKIVIAREITAAPRVLLVGQPTRGVDIGAIEFIHQQLLALRDAGCAILLVSVELDEILALADRILVLNAGRIVGTVPRAEAERYEIGMMMAGIAREVAA